MTTHRATTEEEPGNILAAMADCREPCDSRIAQVALDNGADLIELSLRRPMPLNVVACQ
jgi:hypothetical protein